MNRAETAEAVKVMAAYVDGEDVEGGLGVVGGSWWTASDPAWDWYQHTYRIKPTPRTIPWTAATFPKDRPVWVCRRTPSFGNYWDKGIDCMVVCTGAAGVNLFVPSEPTAIIKSLRYDLLAELWMQHDGTPCGTTEEAHNG